MLLTFIHFGTFGWKKNKWGRKRRGSKEFNLNKEILFTYLFIIISNVLFWGFFLFVLKLGGGRVSVNICYESTHRSIPWARPTVNKMMVVRGGREDVSFISVKLGVLCQNPTSCFFFSFCLVGDHVICLQSIQRREWPLMLISECKMKAEWGDNKKWQEEEGMHSKRNQR